MNGKMSRDDQAAEPACRQKYDEIFWTKILNPHFPSELDI
jgi:hypothetical protein